METNNGSSNIYQIEPLKGADNYMVLKIKMTDILTDQGLWEYVDPGTAPSDANQKPAMEKKDMTALLTIQLQVADKLLVYIWCMSPSHRYFCTKNIDGPNLTPFLIPFKIGSMHKRQSLHNKA